MAAPATVPACNCLAVRQAARQITQFYDTALVPAGIRATQYSILLHLERHEPISLIDLAARLVMDRSTIGRNLRPLERDGLVETAPASDRRVRAIRLSAAGRTRLEEARGLWQAAQARFEGRYGAAQAGALRALLRLAVESVEAAGTDP